MRAILLCAGFATRLRPLTDDQPKPLLPVRGRPLLDDLVDQLVATGRVDHLVVVTNGRFAGHFEAWCDARARSSPESRIDLVNDGALGNESRLGAVGDLALALETFPASGPTLVAAGDNLFRFDLPAFLGDCAQRPRNLILSYREPDLARLRRSGVAVLGPGRRVERFVEKPADPPADCACPPLYCFEPSALALVPEFLGSEPAADPPGGFLAWLVAREPVFAHEMRGSRFDVGTVEAYRAAEAWLDARDADS
ncbi:MAG: nucleotidyltransferase family protein [Myxococcota bacterium]|nr:nucleotidyltransferase family protein [bacterium]MDP6074301.1 nucleotidyltransferase family protein [Myxococcota bacterium]MDP6243523.1 nucleotidyltransferase family protein [Myxococcota bacterium]MDP7073687.1 nucleotidyltransferase family protein [Myxococcota bacterium]MDP7298672.1 nucleotidyltransferase family protein [Myxococcota bacterium]